MMQIKTNPIVPLALTFLLYIHPALAVSQATQSNTFRTGNDNSITIKSNTLEIDNKHNIVTFEGNVDARSEDIQIECQKIILIFKNLSGIKGPGKISEKISRIVAEEEVIVSLPQNGYASAEKAVFISDDGKLLLTGNAIVKQGEDSLKGAAITVFLKEGRIVVENAEAVFVPEQR